MRIALALTWVFRAFVALAILFSLVRLCQVGPRAYFRTAFQMDPETWRLIGVLFLVGIVALTMFSSGLRIW